MPTWPAEVNLLLKSEVWMPFSRSVTEQKENMKEIVKREWKVNKIEERPMT